MTSGCCTFNWPSFLCFSIFVFGSCGFWTGRFVMSIRTASCLLYSVLFPFSVHCCTWLKFQHRVSRTCPLFAAVKCFVVIVPWLANLVHKVTKFVVTSPFWKYLCSSQPEALGLLSGQPVWDLFTEWYRGQIFHRVCSICEPGSVVGIDTGYGLDRPGIESRWRGDFPHLSRPGLEPALPPVQWVPGLSRV